MNQIACEQLQFPVKISVENTKRGSWTERSGTIDEGQQRNRKTG